MRVRARSIWRQGEGQGRGEEYLLEAPAVPQLDELVLTLTLTLTLTITVPQLDELVLTLTLTLTLALTITVPELD